MVFYGGVSRIVFVLFDLDLIIMFYMNDMIYVIDVVYVLYLM